MNLQNSIKLTQLFDAGYIIQIASGPYVTGNILAIGKEDYDDDDSPYVYTDEFYTDRPLSEVYPEQIKVLRPIDWLNPLIMDQLTSDGIPIEIDSTSFIDQE